MVLAIVLVLSAALAASQDDVDPALEQKVSAALRAWELSELAERLAAEQTLIGLGPDANIVLNRIADDLSDELREVVARAQAVWSEQRAQALFSASRVSLSSPMTAADALASLSRQSGIPIVGGEAESEPLELAADQADFWPTLDRVLQSAQLRLFPYGAEPGELRVVAAEKGEADSTTICYDGPFRVQAIRCEATRDLANPAASQMQVVLGVHWEPRLLPVAFQQPASEIHARSSDSAAEIAPRTPDAIVDAVVQREIPYVELSVPFALPPRSIKRMHIQGTLYAIVPGVKESFEFADVSEASIGRKIRKGGLTMQLAACGAEDDLFSLRVRLAFDDAQGALESFRGWIMSTEMELNDGMGTTYPAIGSEVSLLSKNEASIRWLYAQDPNDLNLVVRSPTSIHRVPIRVEMRDVILP
jgi:hypothetical protein